MINVGTQILAVLGRRIPGIGESRRTIFVSVEK